MPSIINQVRTDKTFIEKLEAKLNEYLFNELYEKERVKNDSVYGLIYGSITDIESTSKIDFDKSKETVEDLIWYIEVTLYFDETVGYTNSDGAYETELTTDIYRICANVIFPTNTLALESLEDIIEKLEIETTDYDIEDDTTSEEEK